MNTLLKYVGVIILLIGVAILAIPTVLGAMTNTILICGLIAIVVGYLAHIFLNKKFE